MRSVRADPGDSVGAGAHPPVYRVRIWAPPPAENYSWFVDEWDVSEAEQVTDVIEWAASTANGNPFEVFYRWHDSHTSSDGAVVQRPRYTLIYGKQPTEETGTTETVVLESG